MVIAPLFATLICINLRFYTSFKKITRILYYLGTFLTILFIEFCIARLIKQDFLIFLLWILGYLFLLFFVTIFISNYKDGSISKQRKRVGISSLIIIPSIYFFSKSPTPFENPNFEKEVVNTLKIKLISTDSLYNASHMDILGDTVAGFYEGRHVEQWEDGGPDYIFSGYFIRSIKDSSYRHIISTNGYSYSDYDLIYSKGSIVLKGDRNGNLIRRLYPDGTQVNYFPYNGDYFHIGNRLIYKNLQILSNDGTFLIFDETAQEMVLEKPGKAFNDLIGNLLIFVENKGGILYLSCLDLDKVEVVWSHFLMSENEGSSSKISDELDLSSVNQVFAYKANDGIYILESLTGKLKWKYRWQFSDIYDNKVFVDEHYTYLSDGSFTRCYERETNKMKWETPNVRLYGLFKEYVIATSLDKFKKLYFFIDRKTGKIIKKVAKSENRKGIRLVGDYIFIDNKNFTNVYQ